MEAGMGCTKYQRRWLALRWTNNIPGRIEDTTWSLFGLQVFQHNIAVQVLGCPIQRQGKSVSLREEVRLTIFSDKWKHEVNRK